MPNSLGLNMQGGKMRRYLTFCGVAFVWFVSSLPQSAEFIPFRTAEIEAVRIDASPSKTGSDDALGLEGSVELLFKGGMTAMGAGDLAGAKKAFVRTLEIAPEHLAALVNLGWIAQREKEWTEAHSYLKRAQRVSPDNAAVWLALGVVYLEQGQIEFALAAFSQVVAIEPENARAHRMLGLALGRKGWHSGAEEELRRSLALEPSDPGAHFNLAVIYLQRQPVALELARRHYHRSVDLGGASDPSIEALLVQTNFGETDKKPPVMVRK